MLTIYFAPLDGKSGSEAVRRLLARAWEDWRGGTALPPLVRMQNGKPEFAHTAHCALTHSRTLAAVALCESPVGVDAETIRAVNPRLFRRVLAPEERRWLEGQAEPNAAFLRLWTLNEAYLKYTGEGLRRWPDSLCFLPDGAAAGLRGKPELCFGTAERAGCLISWCAPKPQTGVCYKRLENL